MSVTQTDSESRAVPDKAKGRRPDAPRPGCPAASNRHRRLRVEQVERYQPWFENNRRMWGLLGDLEAVPLQAVERARGGGEIAVVGSDRIWSAPAAIAWKGSKPISALGAEAGIAF